MRQKTQNHFLKFSIHVSVRKPREKLHGKSKASLWRNLSTDTLPNFFSTILCFVALLQFIYFFSVKPFCGNYSTFDSRANTVISHMFAYWSRAVTRSIQKQDASFEGTSLMDVSCQLLQSLSFFYQVSTSFAVMPVQYFLGVMYRQLPNS